MLGLIFHAFYTDTIWMFLCEQNHVIGGLLHHQLLLVCEHLHFIVDTAYPHLLFLWERIQVIVDNIYHHLVFHLAIFRKVHLSIEHTLGEPFIYYNGILVIIFGTVALLVLFSIRALVAVAKNIGIAMFKFKSADSELLKQIETCERAAIVLQSAWRRKQAQTNLLISLVGIIMIQSVARRYLSKDEMQGRRKEVHSRQIKARFDSDFLPKHGELWRRIASAVDDDDTSTTEEEYNTNSSPVETRQYDREVSSVAESDAPEPNHRLTRKARRVALARRNVQEFAIRDKARVDAAKKESYAARRLISFREKEKADCFSDLSEEEEFLGLMYELRAMEIIRMSTLFYGIADALADAADNHRH
jgi:hypothetical protein